MEGSQYYSIDESKVEEYNKKKSKKGENKSLRFYRQYSKSFRKLLKKNNQKYKFFNFALFFSSLYEIIMVPIYLAFDFLLYDGLLIVLEILVCIIYISHFVGKIKQIYDSYSSTNSNYYKKKKKSKKFADMKLKKILILIFYFYIIIPWTLLFDIFELNDRKSSILLVMIQILRICPLNFLFAFFKLITKRNPAISTILKIIYSYIILSHMIACLFICVGRTELDFNNMWFRTIPAPQVKINHYYKN